MPITSKSSSITPATASSSPTLDLGRRRVNAAREVETAWKEELEANSAQAGAHASDYEKKRLARIQENFKVMEDIGLQASSLSIPQSLTNVVKKKNPANRKRKVEKKQPAVHVPRRSSRRLRGDAPTVSMDSSKGEILKACNEDGALCSALLLCQNM